ncbi:13126_t:CDS:1, partial [Dentiscutata heterogama]
TISRTLRKANLVSRVAYIKPFVSDKTKKERKDWAEQHLNWMIKDWKSVLWLDKKYFTLVHSNLYQHVWRRPGEEFNDDCLVSAIRFKGIMMWGCFL